MRAQLMELTPDKRTRIAEGMMIEHCLHQGLTIIKCSFDGDRMNVGIAHRGHHPALHVGDPTLRKQHDNVYLRAAAKSLNRGTACVA